MTARVAGPILQWLGPRRRRALEAAWADPGRTQEAALRALIDAARDTAFGRCHGFADIRTMADYQARVPVRGFLDLHPWWRRAAGGEADVIWPGRPRRWVKTSGTTAGDKVIPVTPEALTAHRRGGWDALLLAAERVGPRHLLEGPLLFLGGSSNLAPHGRDGAVGDLSGLVVRRLPPGIRGRYSPGPAIAAIRDWETRLRAVAARAAGQDLRLLSGMPSWLLILFERVAAYRLARGAPSGEARDLGALWPNLRVLVHGGMAFPPYARLFDEWLGRPLERLEVYPASEGFVGLQTERTGGLTLMIDYGLFYEFVPVEDVTAARPRRHTVAEVELDRPYAVVLSTPAGLWSYLLGDTVRFVARDPLRLVITGRIRHFVNAFGENVIVEEVERALTEAGRREGAEVVEFTVAPRYPSPEEPRGGHEWLVEFRRRPASVAGFARALDEGLAALNTDYRTKRAGDVGLTGPAVTPLPPGTIHRWLREGGRLGDQHKVPRVTNDRAIADALRALAGLSPGEAATAPARARAAG